METEKIYAIAVIVVPIVFFLIFRKNIGGFIDRIKSAERGRLELGEMPQFNKAQPDNNKTENDWGSMKRFGDLPAFSEQESEIKRDLESKAISGENAVEILTRHLAVAQVCRHFEWIYQAIFGSQISLLRYINARPVEQNRMQAYFDALQKPHPEFVQKGWNLDSYLNFLIQQMLIAQQNDLFSITDKGKSFLAWLSLSGQREK